MESKHTSCLASFSSMCISKPEYYILHLLLFNVIGLTHYTSHTSYISHVTDFPKLPVKPARLLVRGSVDNEQVGRLSYHRLLLLCFSGRRHTGEPPATPAKGQELLDGKGWGRNSWGNMGEREGFSAMWVPNRNTQMPSCLGSHPPGLPRIPVFPFQPLLDLSKFLPSLGDKNLNTACSHQLW